MNRNCRRKTEKVYVKVTSDFDATGYMQPRQITWGDGRTYPIEQVRDFRPANTIADLPGDCYTVMVSCTMQRALTLSRPTLNWQEWKSPL